MLPLHDNLFQNQRDHNLEVAVRRPCRDDDFASGHEWPIDARTLTSREGRRRGDGATGSGGFGRDPGWSPERSGCRSSPDFQQVRRLPARTTSTSQGLQSLPFLPKSLIEPGGPGHTSTGDPAPLHIAQSSTASSAQERYDAWHRYLEGCRREGTVGDGSRSLSNDGFGSQDSYHGETVGNPDCGHPGVQMSLRLVGAPGRITDTLDDHEKVS